MFKSVFIICFLVSSIVISQNKKPHNSIPSRIVFQSHLVKTQRVTDTDNLELRNAFKATAESSGLTEEETKKYTNSALQFKESAQDIYGSIIFCTNQESYLVYHTPFPDYFGYNFKKIERDSLVGYRVQLQDLSSSPERIRWFIEEDYEILEINKSDRKKIQGFDCYKIRIQYAKRPFIWEMYVTNELILNYHPIFKHKSLLKEFFPLELRYVHQLHKEEYQYSYKITEIQR